MLTGYTQQRTIDITATGVGGGQLRVDIHAGNADWAAILSNGGDIRFTTLADTLLPIWIERFDYANQVAMVWVKLPATQPASVLLQYGNAAATSVSDYAATMQKKHVDANTIAAYHFEAQSGASESGAFPATVTGMAWGGVDAGSMANFFVLGGANSISFPGSHPVFNATAGRNISIPGLLDTPTAAFSISFWFKPAVTRPRAGISAGQRLFCKVNTLGPDNFIEAYILDSATPGDLDNGRIHLRVAVAGTTHTLKARRPHTRSDRWYHIVADCGPLGIRLWINGLLEAHLPAITGVPGAGANDPFRLGSGYQNSNNFDGAMGCLCVDGRQMNRHEVWARFQRRGYFPIAAQADKWVKGGQVFGDNPTRPQSGEPSVLVVGGIAYAYIAEAVTDGSDIWQAVSASSNGTTWAQPTTLILGNGVGGESGDPLRNAVFLENGTYYLYYPVTRDGGVTKQMFVATATSPTGPFTYQGLVLASDALFTQLENPDVKKVGATYIMMLDGGGIAATQHYPMRIATATNPLGPFAFQGSGFLRSLKEAAIGEGHAVWRVPATGGGYHIWYHAEEDFVVPGHTYYARSYEASATRHDNYFPSQFGPVRVIENANPLIDQWSDVCVFEFGGSTYMLRSEANNSGVVTARIQQDTYGGGIDALVAETHYSFAPQAPANQAKFIFSNGRPIFQNGKLVTLTA